MLRTQNASGHLSGIVHRSTDPVDRYLLTPSTVESPEWMFLESFLESVISASDQ